MRQPEASGRGQVWRSAFNHQPAPIGCACSVWDSATRAIGVTWWPPEPRSPTMAPPPANTYTGARHFQSKDMSRLLRCADRPELVTAVSTLPRESTRQYRVARSAFHATDRRDVHAARHLSSARPGRRPRRVERDFADQVRPFRCPSIFVLARKEIRDEAERRQLNLLRGNVDLVMLAPYMQS